MRRSAAGECADTLAFISQNRLLMNEEQGSLFKEFDGILLLGSISHEMIHELRRIIAWSVDRNMNPSRMLLSLFPGRYLKDYQLRLYHERVLETRKVHYPGEGLKNISCRKVPAQLGDVWKEGRTLCRHERYGRHYQVIWRLNGKGNGRNFTTNTTTSRGKAS